MMSYGQGDSIGDLDQWPFDAPASEYRIIAGDHRASGRLDAGGPGHVTRTGIWRCTPGVLDCIEQGDELMTVLAGEGLLIDRDSGEARRLAPGHTLFIRDGMRARWRIAETVTKVFFGHKTDGY